jgi:SAM-dependent methyltransferase
MRPEVLSFLACPACGGDLTLEGHEPGPDGHVSSGHLSCGKQHHFPIEEGVPVLLPNRVDAIKADTADRFSEEWHRWSDLRGYYEDQFLGWIAPVGRDDFVDKVVFEGGCGKGRHTSIVSSFGARAVVAIDLGQSAYVAFKNTRDQPNAHVVIGDLLSPPVKPCFDLAFSVGVIHHLPNPEAGFQRLSSVVRPGGRVVVWVYGKENNEWITRWVDPLRTNVTARIPSKALWALTAVPAAALTAAIKLIYNPKRASSAGRHLPYQEYFGAMHAFPYDEIHSIVFDQLVTPVAHYLSGDEVRAWFSTGFKNPVVRWHNEYSWTGTALVEQRRAGT